MRSIDARQARYRIPPQSPRGGGEAQLLRALDERGRAVAIKLGARPEELEALRAAQGLPGLVELLDEGEHKGRTLLVLPWYEHDMGSWLRGEPGLPERLGVLAQAARALAGLHERGLLHADLKPANLLLRPLEEGWELALSDLGASHEALPFTRAYAPPEQQLPLVQRARPDWDLHALGATAYHLLTGRLPESLLQREALFTNAAMALRQRALDSGPEALELGELFELERARALLPGDRARLQAELEDLGAGAEQAQALERWIEGVLEPLPADRRGSLQELLELLGPPEEPDPRPRRGWLAVPLGVLALLGLAWLLAPPPASPDPQPEAPPAPIHAPLSEPAAEPLSGPAPAEESKPVAAEPSARAPALEPSVEGPPLEEAVQAEPVELRFLHASSAVFEVSLDGEPVGRVVDVVPGEHQVELRASGRRPCKQAISVEESGVWRCTDRGGLEWQPE